MTEDNLEILTNSNKEKSEVLSDYFASVFTYEPESLPLESELFTVESTLKDIEITSDDVKKQLEPLKPDKSPGPDDLHPRVLKEIADVLSPHLATMYKTSLNTGELPDDWKTAKIIPIFKKGDRKYPSNYRPVSLTSFACKILESLLRNKIIEHLKRNELLSKRQYGFVSGCSAVLQMLNVLDEWTETLDQSKEIDCIYFDFKKAFDSVPHKRLLLKLKTFGIEGKIFDWIKSFLTNRRQRVVVEGEISSYKNVLSGIPQGSVLGPLLFILFVNDLPQLVNSELFMFADDIKLFREITSLTDQDILQDDINTLKMWSDEWLLKFNHNKCKSLSISRNRQIPERTYYLSYGSEPSEKNNELIQVDEETDLGLILDAKLHFENHIYHKINKANQIMGIIRRSFIHLNKRNFVLLFKSLIRPHLEYMNQIWSPHKKKDIQAIESVQRRATKLVPELKNKTYQERLKILELPTLVYRRLRGDMIETYKIINIYDSNAVPNITKESHSRTR